MPLTSSSTSTSSSRITSAAPQPITLSADAAVAPAESTRVAQAGAAQTPTPRIPTQVRPPGTAPRTVNREEMAYLREQAQRILDNGGNERDGAFSQLLGLTLGSKELNAAQAVLTDPIVGVYDGESGSLVRAGAVGIELADGVSLLDADAVYLSTEPGKITNVKPTTGIIHEIGVVVSASAETILLQPKPPFRGPR